MATARILGSRISRIVSLSYRSRSITCAPVTLSTLMWSYGTNGRAVCQFQNSRNKRSDSKESCNTTSLLPVLFGLSLFGKSETKDEEQKETQGEKEDILEDEVITVLKHAKLKEMKQELQDAEHLYHRALGLLNIYEQNSFWDRKRILQARVFIFDHMANLALARGEIDKAEKLYKETLRGSLQQGMSPNHDAVVEISLKLAMIYAAQKKNVEANEGYRFCIKTQEEKIKNMKEVDDNSAALLGMAIDAYARFLMVQNRYTEALENLEKSLDIAVKVFGESHPQVAVLLNDIATVCSLKQDYDLAKTNLEKAIKIAEAVESPDLPTFYFNLGAIYEHQGNVTEATSAYKKAQAKAKKLDDKIVQKKAKDALDKLKKSSSKK